MPLTNVKLLTLLAYLIGFVCSFKHNYDFVFEVEEESPIGRLVGELIDFQLPPGTNLYPSNNFNNYPDLYDAKMPSQDTGEKVYLTTYNLADTAHRFINRIFEYHFE